MRTLFTGIATASALALLASAAQACEWHNNVSASAGHSQQSVAMSTHDGTPLAPTVADDVQQAEAAAAIVCEDGDKDCAPATVSE